MLPVLFAIQDAVAGYWPLIRDQGIGGLIFIGLLAGSIFSPVLKKDLFYAALIVAAWMVAEDIGIHDEKVHCVAQEQLVNKKVEDVVRKSRTPAILHKKDPWNDPKN